MNDAETIENFYGVYLLYCENPKFKGRIYIGYTVDPNRRIKQHNKGKKFGGAWRTSNKGPWSMVMVIHGFPNDISALRFEWAWQHPHVSRRLRHVQKKKSRETSFDFHFRVLSEMLTSNPWSRLPLTVQWLNSNFIREFPCDKCPPEHVLIRTGIIISKKSEKSSQGIDTKKISNLCDICHNFIEERHLSCSNILCDLKCHIKCLAEVILEPGEYVPVGGTCPKCAQHFLWGDFIRKYKGYCNDQDITINWNVEQIDLE